VTPLLSLLAAPFSKLLLYALIAFAGNFAFLRLANRACAPPDRPLKSSVLISAAALRLALGVVAGVVANVILLKLPTLPNPALVLLVAFLPLRAGLWYLVLGMFFDREKRAVLLIRRWTAFGVVVSYLLDTPAVFLGVAVLGSIA
jgi:hypothetical protein